MLYLAYANRDVPMDHNDGAYNKGQYNTTRVYV